MVHTNVDAVLRPLTEKEREVQEEIEMRFSKPLPQKHWGGGAQGTLAGNETRLDIEMPIIIDIVIVFVYTLYSVWLYIKVVYAMHPRISQLVVHRLEPHL